MPCPVLFRWASALAAMAWWVRVWELRALVISGAGLGAGVRLVSGVALLVWRGVAFMMGLMGLCGRGCRGLNALLVFGVKE